jgi:predicted permease
MQPSSILDRMGIAIETIFKDLRYALRMLANKPGFGVVAVLTLAVGIGANTAIFSVVNSLLLHPLPFDKPDRLVWLWGTNPKNGIKEEYASPPDFLDWKSQNQTFEDMATVGGALPTLTGLGEPERVLAAYVSSNFFSVLGVRPELGRTFLPDDDQPGKDHVLVLANWFWKTRLAADPKIVGKTLTLGAGPGLTAYSIIGVMPSDFQNARPDDYKPVPFWMPHAIDYNNADRRRDSLGVFARLKTGASVAHAQEDLNLIASRLEQQYPDTNTGWRTKVIPLRERFVGDLGPALLVLMGAVCFLLLIACANLANLMLARTADRRREIAIRAALGAGRGRLIQRTLTESVLLSVMGGGLGVVLAIWGIRLLVRLSPRDLARISNTRIDLKVLGFTLSICIITGLTFGLLPARQALKRSILGHLKEGGRTSGEGTSSRRTRDLLAAAEIALALALLVGAGLMIRSFTRLQKVDPGFRTDNLLTAMVLLSPTKFPRGQVDQACIKLLEDVKSVPGVLGAEIVSSPPLSGEANYEAFTIEGRSLQPDEKQPDAENYTASVGYFQMMGIPLMGGRTFNQFDSNQSPPVVVINRTLAEQYFHEQDPVGKRINLGDPKASPWLTIVGIVGDVKSESMSVPAYAQLYTANAQDPQRAPFLVVRTAKDPMSLLPAIKQQWWGMDKDQPLWAVNTLEGMHSDLTARPRFNTVLLVIFAAVAVILALVGVFGVVSYSVAQRTHEIGVRMALGADKKSVLKMVLLQGASVAIIGIAIGLGIAFALTRLMTSLLFTVKATDPVTFAAVPLLLAAVTILASYIPARRATRVDPMVALREE